MPLQTVIEKYVSSKPLGSLPSTGARYKHRERGSVYVIIGLAERQTNGLGGGYDVVYRDVILGNLHTREVSEFMDGRFLRID